MLARINYMFADLHFQWYTLKFLHKLFPQQNKSIFHELMRKFSELFKKRSSVSSFEILINKIP